MCKFLILSSIWNDGMYTLNHFMPARFDDRCVNTHKNLCNGNIFIIDSLFAGQANKGNDVVLACPRQKKKLKMINMKV